MARRDGCTPPPEEGSSDPEDTLKLDISDEQLVDPGEPAPVAEPAGGEAIDIRDAPGRNVSSRLAWPDLLLGNQNRGTGGARVTSGPDLVDRPAGGEVTDTQGALGKSVRSRLWFPEDQGPYSWLTDPERKLPSGVGPGRSRMSIEPEVPSPRLGSGESTGPGSWGS